MRQFLRLFLAVRIAAFVVGSALAQAPPPVITGLGSQMASGLGFSPGSFALIVGRDLAGSTENCSTPTGLPTDWCADVQVVVADTAGSNRAAIRSVAPALLVVQIPVESRPGQCAIRVTRRVGGQTLDSSFLGFTLDTHAPALATADGSGQGLGEFRDQSGRLINQANPARPGDIVWSFAGGLGSTTPQAVTGRMPSAAAPTETQPRVTVAGQQAAVLLSVLLPNVVGVYQVNFRVPENIPAGDQPVRLEMGGKSSNTVLLPVVVATKPAIVSAVNAASGEPGLVSGSWFTIYGSNLASTSRPWKDSDFAGNKLPTALDGVSVKLNGKSAAISYISPAQVNAQAPTDSALGSVTVEVQNSLGTATAAATLQSFAPAFFLFSSVEQGKYLAGVHPDGVLVGKRDLFQGALAARPAKAGDVILLFGGGFGVTAPAVPAGEIFAGAAPLVNPGQLTIKIGGVAADVRFAGLVGAGLYQFNVVVPGVAAGDQAVVAEIGGFSSQANKFITIE